jgi:hypothetical protein
MLIYRLLLSECSYPPYLNDTSIQVTLETGSLHVLYSCNDGENVIGNGEITCQSNQAWSEPLFFCSGKYISTV